MTNLPTQNNNSYVGKGDFKKIGEEYFQLFKNFAGLMPSHKVLDVGSGIGRMAIPLMNYLKEGTYDGFDIVPHGIKWCQENISTKSPNFIFQVADIYNKMYNPQGKQSASKYIFPYHNNCFDFVFLTSVFTHMLQKDLEHYLSEISRVTKTGGTVFLTFFLLNNKSISLIESKKSNLNFKFQFENGLYLDDKTPEAAIAYNEDYIQELLKKNGFSSSKKTIYYGSWSSREDSLSYQDIWIIKKNQ